VVNGAAAVEAVLAVAERTGSPLLTAAVRRQLHWLLVSAPRAADGTLMHVLDLPQVWSDSVYMVLPALVATGHVAEADRQLEGHRSRLQDPRTKLFAHIWDDAERRFARGVAWGGGNGWVVAGCARAIRLLRRRQGAPDASRPVVDGFTTRAASCAREVLDACLAHRADSGLFHDIVDDPGSFEEVTLTAMLSYGILTGVADGWLPSTYLPIGRSLLDAAAAHTDEDGLLRPACGAPTFDRPGISAEAQALFLMANAAAGRAEPV
jgi:unsaturated rhamnogalacturonyl hydrolase